MMATQLRAGSKPAPHMQVYVPSPSMQWPPFWHGLDAHSSTSAPQAAAARRSGSDGRPA